MFDYNKKHSLGLFGAYLSLLAYMNKESQRKFITKHINRFELIQRNHKSVQYFVLHDFDNKTTFVAIRGTDTSSLKESLRDFGVSLRFFAKRINGARVHRGYAEAGDAINEDLKTLLVHDDHRLVLVGHSLGGVLAKYCGIMMKRECQIFTYGAPKLAGKRFYKDIIADITSYINVGDAIPDLPPTFSESKLRNFYLMDEDGEAATYSIIRNLIIPLAAVCRYTVLVFLGKLAVSLRDHSIKSYIRQISKIVKIS